MTGKRSLFLALSVFIFCVNDLFPQAATISGWRHPDFSYCIAEGGDSLVGASPSGKPFYFDGVSYTVSTILVRTSDGNAIFYPNRTTVGTHTIVYGTIGSHDVTVQVTIKAPVPVTLLPFQSVCANTPAFSLFNADSSNVSPKNGKFSGPGVDATGHFNPVTAGPGTHTITYTAGVGSCLSSVTQTLKVTALPVLSMTPFSPVCEGTPAFGLTQGNPAGGIYSGPGVDGSGNFDPLITGMGIFPITYTYTNGTCSNSAVANISVVARPTASITGLNLQYCTNDAGITINGNPAGITGVFSGDGITDNRNGTAQFDPALAGLGSHDVQYIYTTAQGCKDTAMKQVQVGTNVIITGLASQYCVNHADIAVSAVPVGGSFAILPGLTDHGNGTATFSPAAAGAGVHTVTYSYVDGFGCINTRSISVTVYALPVPSMNLAPAYCANTPVLTIRGNFAPLGTFTGPSTLDNGNGTATFNPSALMAGNTYNITYNYTSPATGCQGSITNAVVINPLPSAVITGNAEICHGSPVNLTINLSGTGPFSFNLFDGSGTYGYTNVAGPAINTQVFPADTTSYRVTTVTDSKGCSNAGTGTAAINVLPEVSVLTQPVSQRVCPGSNVGFTLVASGNNLQYQWQKNGVDIAGSNQASLFLNNVQAADIAAYHCVVSGDCGVPITSNDALLQLWSPVEITVNPSGIQTCEGSGGSLQVNATGSNLKYQWYRNNSALKDTLNYTGTVTPSLFMNSMTPANAGNYYVAVDNICGSVNSSAVIVTVDRTIIINNQPSSQTICSGSNALMNVNATGDNLSYQWQFNNADLPGENSPVLSIPACTAADQGFYNCIVKSSCGSQVITSPALLTVNQTPAITSNPGNLLRCEGDNAVFRTTATGSSLNYQWKKGNSNLADNARVSGSQTAILTITGLTGSDVAQYSCVVSGLCDTLVSTSATLIVDSSLSITGEPQDVNACLNNNIFFSVTASGNNVSYQWYKNGVPVAGANTAVLVINNIKALDAAQYMCMVTNTCGRSVNSRSASLTINDNVLITGQPSASVVCEGNNAIFNVSAIGTGLIYRWEYNGVALTDHGSVSGTGTSSLIIQKTVKADQGVYNCLVTGSCGSERSIPVTLTVNDTLSVSKQPESIFVCEGNNAQFSIVANGVTGYQWQKNMTNIPGKTTSVLLINNVTAADSGVYRCVLTNECDTLATDGASLVVKFPVQITSNPSSGNACTGLQVQFTSAATGSDLLWQWYKDGILLNNGTGISGASTSTLVINPAAVVHFGVYTATVNGFCGSAVTNPALLNVNEPAVITSQPKPLSVCENQSASFTVAADNVLSYQWQKDNVDLAGKTQPSLSINGVAQADAGVYRCRISGACGDISSDGALLTVNSNIVVTTQPAANISSCTGQQVTIQTLASGTGLSYQWKHDGVNLVDNAVIAGSNQSTLLLNNATSLNSGVYQCIITSTCGSVTGNAADVQILPLTTLISQPQSAVICSGQQAVFALQAAGINLTYQWQKDGVNIPGAVSANHTINAVQPADSGIYRCIITGSCNQVISQGARLTVDIPPVVTVQPPATETICENNQFAQMISATGSNLSFKWYFNGTVITDGMQVNGSSSPLIRINPVTTAYEGIYFCEVSNACSSTATTGMQVWVSEIPVIIEQPQNTDACQGENIALRISVTGDNLTYQWQKNGISIAGAVNPVLAINNVSSADSGSYQCIVQSVCGQLHSSAAQVRIFEPVSIAVNPPLQVSQCEGTMLSLNVSASGSILAYQWKKDGVNLVNNGKITGVQTAALRINNLTVSDEGFYTCEITGNCNTETTTVTTVDVLQGPLVITQPSDIDIVSGGNGHFAVSVSGDNLSYQWYFNGIVLHDGAGITGTNSGLLQIINTNATHEGAYNVVVTGACGVTASNATALRILASSVITANPPDVIKCQGETHTFVLQTSGGGHTYKWKRNGALIADNAKFSGTQTSQLTINNLSPSDAGSFSCQVDNAENSVPALLHVNRTTSVTFATGANNMCTGSVISFYITASGDSLDYAWYRNGSAMSDNARISGSSSTALTIKPAAITDAGSYVCMVSGACGSAASDPQVIIMSEPVTLLNGPSDTTVCEGQTLILTSTVTGTVQNWQWYKNNTALSDIGNISGSKNQSLIISDIAPGDEGNYFCVISGRCNAVYTPAAVVNVNKKTAITVQPVDLTKCKNDLAVFTVKTNNSDDVFQWRKNGSDLNDNASITGSHSALLKISNLQSADAGTYQCNITGKCNSVLSSAVDLKVNDPAVITAQPAGGMICEGMAFSFSVSATGSSLTYQWLKDGSIIADNARISGSTTPVLTINGSILSDAGVYQCKITGVCGFTESSYAILSVNKYTALITEPANNQVCNDNDVTLALNATGSANTYQWQRNNVAITDGLTFSGTGTPVLHISHATNAESGIYRCIITGACNAVTSNTAQVTIIQPPVITLQPLSSSVCEGNDVLPGIQATGDNLVYLWKFNGGAIASSDISKSQLSIQHIASSSAGLYTCSVTNVCGTVNSDPALISVNKPGSITRQPVDVTMCAGDQAGFTVDASGDNLSYQWQFIGADLNDDARISGSNTRALVITHITSTDQGNYRCVITDGCGNTLNSDPAALNVNLPLDNLAVSDGDTVCEGQNVSLTITVSGSNPVYQWYRNGTAIADGFNYSGSQTASLMIGNTVKAISGYFTCRVTGSCGSLVSAPTPVLILSPVTITEQPANLDLCAGEPAIFTVEAQGDSLKYQWFRNGTTLTDNITVNGSQNSILVITGTNSALSGSFYCRITNNCGSINSQAAALTVRDYPTSAEVITGDSVICQDVQGLIYSVPAISGADSYKWTLPPGMVIESGDNTRQITASFARYENGGILYVQGVNGCGTGPASPIVNIKANPLPLAYAGENSGVCSTVAVLTASDPGPAASATWKSINGPAQIDQPVQLTTEVRNLRNGENRFAWVVSLNGCIAADTVSIYNNQVHVEAGTDTSICSHVYRFDAIPPTEGSGKWSIQYGSGYNIDRYNATSRVSGLSRGLNIFRWSVTNNGCVSYDTVLITDNLPSDADAGNDQFLHTDNTRLGASSPSVGTGQWSLLNGSAVIMDPLDHLTQVTSVGQGVNIFEWTVTYKGCVSTDTVVIKNMITDTTDAGPNQTICSSVVRLNAKNPYPGYGEWSVKRGAATFVKVSEYNTYAYNLSQGQNVLIWTQYLNGITHDSVVIINNLPTTSNAGVSVSVCFDSVKLNANPPYIGTGLWTIVNGSGSFENSASNTTSVTDLARGSNVFKWTITNEGCTSSSQVTVNDNRPTDAEAGFDVTICEDTLVLNPNLPTFGTGEWSVLSGAAKFKGNVVYDLGRDENRLMYSIRNYGCYSRDTLTITSHKPTQAKLSPDQSVCQDSILLTANVPLTGSGIWSIQSGSAAIENFSNATSMARQLAPGENVFRWTISYQECISFDDMIISNDFVKADAGTDRILCSDRVALEANDPGYSMGTWSVIGGSTGASILDPHASNSIVEHLSRGANILRWTIIRNSCASYDEVVITNNKPTDAFAGEDVYMCENRITLRANPVSIGTGYWTILSGSGTLADSYNPVSVITNLAAGINVLRWTSENAGCTSNDEVIISNDLPQNVYGGLDQKLCSDSTVLYANPPVNGSGTWSVMQGSASFADASLYNSSVTNLNNGINKLKWTVSSTGCSIADTVIISNNRPTIAVAGSDIDVCNSIGSLIANTPQYGTGEWSLISGAGHISEITSPRTVVENLALGNNTLRWTITNSDCFTHDDIVITNNSPTIADAGESMEVCGETAVLYANIPVVGTGYWSTISGKGVFTDSLNYNTTINSLIFGENTLRWTTVNGNCYTSDEIVVTNNLAYVYAGEDQVVYEDQGILSGNNPAEGTGAWLLVAGTGNIQSPTSFNTSLNSLGAGFNTFEWTITNGSCTARDQVVINFKIMPKIGFTTSETEGCPGITVDFYNTTQYGTTYRWDLGDGTVSSDINTSHTYTYADRFTVRLTAFGPDNRTVTADTVITIHTKPVAAFEFAPDTAVINKPVRFYDNSRGNANSWTWDFGDNESSSDQNPLHYFKNSGEYEVLLQVKTDYGCSDTTSLSIIVNEDGLLIFPNAFTPNPEGPNGGVYSENDHSNDVFHPYIKNVAEFHMEIYSRWGVLLFESNDVNIGWDGYYKGKLLARDVYVWKVSGKYVSGTQFLKTGTVLLIK